MDHQRTNRTGIHRQHDDWDEVHNQMIEVQAKQRIQKKSLAISEPGDADEKEADEVSRKVVSGESAQVHGTGGTINRKGEGESEATPEFQAKLEGSKGGGQSLDDSTRSEMESKMGADFSGVKIHTGGEADAMSESINARAFTHGQDVFFKQGEFDTGSKQGQELLAHELVHTVQQGEGKVQPKIQRDGYVPNEGNTSLTGDDRGAMGYLPNESDFAEAHKSETAETKLNVIMEFLNYKNTSDPDAKSFWQKFQALNEKNGPNGTVLVQSLWEQAVQIKAKSDQAVKDIDDAGSSKRAEMEGLYVRNFTSRGKPYEKKSADWGHWKEYDAAKYNQVPYDHSDNPLLTYTKNKFHGFGSMMVLDDHFTEGQNATTLVLGLLTERLKDEKQFATDVQALLESDPGAARFAALMSALRDISSLVDKITAAKTASEKTGLPLHYTMALYGQEGNFTMPASHASLQAGIPVTERGGLNMLAGGKLVDYSTGNLVVKKFGGDPNWNRFWALSSISLQIGGLDVVNNLFSKVLADNPSSDVATLIKLCIQAAAQWSLGNRKALQGDKTADKTELERSQADLEKLWEEQYNGIQGTDRTHRKSASTSGLDVASVYAPTDPAKLAAFILQEAGFYFKRSINKGKTVSGIGLPFTPEVGYLMYNSGLHPEFIVQAVRAAYKLSKGKPSGTPAGKLGISQDLLDEIKTLTVAKEEDITSAVVKSWLTPARWKLLMDFIPVAGQDELKLTYRDKGTDVNNFQKQINTSNFSTLAKFYKDVFNVQKKSLDISSPKDASEKEADDVARNVVNGKTVQLKAMPSAGKVQPKIQRQGHEPGKDYESGQMRQDFDLHTKEKATMPRDGGTETLYFQNGATVKLISTSADDFWIEVEGEAFYKSGDVAQPAGTKTGWIRRHATTMTKGLYSDLNIVDRSTREKVTVNEEAALNSISSTKVVTPKKKGASPLYFKKDSIVIMGDALTWKDKKETEHKWNEVEGVAYYKVGEAEKAVPGYSKGYVKFSQLNMGAPTATSLGNIGTNTAMGSVKTITLHQTGNHKREDPTQPQSYDDPMAITEKIGSSNQFANYVITSTGEIGLITPVNEQMSQNPYAKMKGDKFLIAKPAATPPATEFKTGDKEFDKKMQGVRDIINEWYKDGTITQEIRDYWLSKKSNVTLFNALETAKWDLFIDASYNQNSISIEVAGDEIILGMPKEKTKTSVDEFRKEKINDNKQLSPNFREQLKNMHWLTFYNYMDDTGDGTVYGDITPQQKYASWLLTNKIAQDAGLPELNARTLVAHTEVDYKARGEGVGNKEFILAMIAYKKTMTDLAALTAKMTEEERTQYDADAAVLTLIDGPQLQAGDTGYESVDTFFTNFYDRKAAMDELLAKLKTRK